MDKEIDLKRLSREYLKSYYSINTHIGCSINCGYCFLAPIKIVPMRPIKVIEEEELINEMLNDKYFKVNETVLSINNRTDPFITEEVKESTFKLLELMDNLRLKNIVTITSKGRLSENDAKRLDEFKNIKVVIIVTYNGIPLNLQPINQENQEITMKNISKCQNVCLLHQFRPIIPNVNDDEQTIRKIFNFAKRYCDATIFQGVRVNDYIKNRLKERDCVYEGTTNERHKQKSQKVDQIFDILRLENLDYQIFEHTSCALSYLFKIPDYNLHFYKNNCPVVCKNYLLCHMDNFKIPCDLTEILKKIEITSNFEIKDKTLLIDGCLNDEQKSYIKHILHLNVKSKEREDTYSERLMEDMQ